MTTPVRSARRGLLAAGLVSAITLLGMGLGASSAWASDSDSRSADSTQVSAAAVVATPDCDHATSGTGQYASAICWLDLSAFKAGSATTPGGQQVTEALPGGDTMTFTLTTSGVRVRAAALPTTGTSVLGSADHYGDIDGEPALYQRGSGESTVTLSDISIVDSGGDPVSGYSVVTADAESTDAGESITWQSDQTLDTLIHNAWTSGLGNSCGVLTGLRTSTVTCSARDTKVRTGTPILLADNPTTLSADLVGAGKEAVAFGIVVSQAQINQTVQGAFPGDAFRVDVTDAHGTVLGSDTSATNGMTSTGRVSFLSDSRGANITLSEAATSGSLANYSHSWSCALGSGPDASLPNGDGGSSVVVLVPVGDFVKCTVSDTAVPASLSLSTQAAAPVDVNGDGLTDRGDTVDYEYVVTNTGSTSIEQVAIADPGVPSASCAATTLGAGETTTCTSDQPHSVTEADVAAGAVHDRATATGNPAGTSATISSAVATADTATTAPAAALGLTSNATIRDTNSDFQIDRGDTINWSFRLSNTGNVPVTGLSVTDPLAGGVTCLVTTLAPGALTTCTADVTYSIAQSDVDAGSVTNTATASALDPDGDGVTSDPAIVTTPVMHRAALSATLRSSVTDVSGDGRSSLGDVITFWATVRNTGTVTLHGIGVSDQLTGAMSCPDAPLAPGSQITCVATALYQITQADVDAGQVSDATTTTALDPVGATVTAAVSTGHVPLG